MFFVVLNPDKKPLKTPYVTMADAQAAIAEAEPDVLEQGKYQIHPVHTMDDLEKLKVKPQLESVRLEKFDGEYVGQAPVEVIDL